jgi:hypothetical protein
MNTDRVNAIRTECFVLARQHQNIHATQCMGLTSLMIGSLTWGFFMPHPRNAFGLTLGLIAAFAIPRPTLHQKLAEEYMSIESELGTPQGEKDTRAVRARMDYIRMRTPVWKWLAW